MYRTFASIAVRPSRELNGLISRLQERSMKSWCPTFQSPLSLFVIMGLVMIKLTPLHVQYEAHPLGKWSHFRYQSI